MDAKAPKRAIFWSNTRKDNVVHKVSDEGVFALISFNPRTKIGRILTMNSDLESEYNAQPVTDFMKIIAALDEFEKKMKLKISILSSFCNIYQS